MSFRSSGRLYVPLALVLLAWLSFSAVWSHWLRPPIIEGRGAATGVVAPGQTATIDWTITKRTGCPGVTGRVWSQDDGYFLAEPLQPTALPEGEGDYRIPTRVPDGVSPGRLELRIVGTFQCPGYAEQPFSLGPVILAVTR